jgi:Zn-dependent peptidase ImmA (M78 family)
MRVRRKHIRRLAESLLSAHSVDSPPVNVKRIAIDEGLNVVELEAEDSLSGFLDRRRGKPLIGVNSKHTSTRRRFTIAHELGHHFLHSESFYFDESVLRFRDALSSEGTDLREMEANLFAAELLMPTGLLEAELADFDGLDLNNDKGIEVLAKRYGVSPQALIYRLNYLELA